MSYHMIKEIKDNKLNAIANRQNIYFSIMQSLRFRLRYQYIFLMIKHLGGLLHKHISPSFLLIPRNDSSFGFRNRYPITFMTFRGHACFSSKPKQLSQRDKKILSDAIDALENNKGQINKLFYDYLLKPKQQAKKDGHTDEGKTNNEDKGNDNTKGNQKGSKKNLYYVIFMALFGTGGKLEYEKGILWTLLNELKERQLKNHKVSKGQKIKENISNHKSEGELKEFQCKQTEQYKQIQRLYQFDDHKVIQYIQAYIGNGLATNLMRYIVGKIDQQKAKNGESITQLYFYDFKEPSADSKALISEWGELDELHNLLTNLIHKGKTDGNQILMINEIDLLAQSFQTLKTQRLNQIFKKILYLSKEKIARVILVSGNHYFFDNYLKKLRIVQLQDFKREITKQMSDNDLRKVIEKRTAYNSIAPILSGDDKNGLDTVINEIIKRNDSVKQIMRLLKVINLDAKSAYEKYLKKNKITHSPQELNKYLSQVHIKSLIDFSAKLSNIKSECKNVIVNKEDRLLKSIGVSDYKNLSRREVQRLKLIEYYKIEILNDICNGKYKRIQAKNAFYLHYDDAKLQAFRELNNDQVLHGFEFTTKTDTLAFKHALKYNAHYLSMRWYWKVVRWFD